MRSSKLATAALTVILALLVLSASIAVPILFRPFYYIQIDALRLPERTGWPEEVIREAYDEVLDFCVLGTPFGTGELSWSESGRSHFADVRVLFRADFLVLGVTAVSAAFTVFHAVFFPGKDNWLFNPATDEIILIMPERFFLNCALLIGAVLLSACGALIAGDLLSAHRRKKKTVLPR